MKIKICIYIRALLEVFPYFYNSLKTKFGENVEILFLVQNSYERKLIKKKIGNINNIIQVDVFFHENWDKFTLEKLVYYENKYKCSPVWKIIYSDRFLLGKT